MIKISKKITLTFFLVLVFTVCLCAFTASAANEGDYVYEIENGEVTITGCAPTISGDVVIPKKLGGITVTAIGEKAFYYCSGITSVMIDNNIKSIGESAFAYCGALSEVMLPEDLEEIADEAFYMCFNLAKATLSKTNIKRIGVRAFAYCEYLETVTLPDTLETVGEEAFNWCNNLQTVIMGKNTVNIAKNAFSKCHNLRSIYYMGTQEEFGKVVIEEGNERLPVCDIYYEHIHKYDSKEKVSDGDCVIKGRTIYTCRCSDSYNEFKYGSHSYKNVITKATFKNDGKTENKCKLCGNVKKTSVIPKVTAKLSKTDYAYTGKAITPGVTVKNTKGTSLTKDKTYTLKYSSGRTEMGKYTVKVTLKGSKYSGSTKLYFNIIPGKPTVTAKSGSDSITLTWNKITGAKGYRVYSYNTETKKYKELKTLSSTSYTVEKLESATDYVFTVRAYGKADGKTVWGSHSFVYTATAPEKVKLTSAVKSAGKVSLSWKAVAADGYEIYMKSGKNSKEKKVGTITDPAKLSYTKSSLKSGVKYYFSVRAYKTVGDAKIYGEFSNVKAVSIK